jgi:alkylated DNA repair dioxygenase AlkB
MSVDLFGAPAIAGLEYRPEFITPVEEQELIGHLGEEDLSPFKFQGWTGKRLTRTFGWRYDFDDRSFAPSEPIPDWLESLRSKAAVFANIATDEFVHALLVRYDPGARIGWHRDRPVFETVVGISLGSPATLRFRRRRPGGFDRANVEVEPRSAYLLAGPVRHEWEHSIAPGDTLRFSITFRSLSDKGRRAAEVSG